MGNAIPLLSFLLTMPPSVPHMISGSQKEKQIILEGKFFRSKGKSIYFSER
jgi:hypothetical protein